MLLMILAPLAFHHGTVGTYIYTIYMLDELHNILIYEC